MGAIRSPRSWDLPEATGEGGGYPQCVSLVFGTGVRICPISFLSWLGKLGDQHQCTSGMGKVAEVTFQICA